MKAIVMMSEMCCCRMQFSRADSNGQVHSTVLCCTDA